MWKDPIDPKLGPNPQLLKTVMPPKAAAAPAVLPVEKKEGAKVVYLTVPLVEGEVLKVSLNPTCRTDILVDAALQQLSREAAKRTTAVESSISSLKAAAGDRDSNGEVGDASTPPWLQDEALLARLKEIAKALATTASVNNVELVEVSNGAKTSLGGALLAQVASEILRPSGVYGICVVDGGSSVPV